MSHFEAKCPTFDSGCGSAPDPLGVLTALPRLPWWIWRALLLREGSGGEEKGRERKFLFIA